MKIASLLLCTIAVLGTAVNAWTEDEACDGHDGESVGDNRRILANLDAENDELATVLSMVNKNRKKQSTTFADENSRNLRGSSQRTLQTDETIESFQLKLHWEEDYCWQLEAIERRYDSTDQVV